LNFLVDADLPRSVAESLRQAGHHALDVRDIGLKDAPDSRIARCAQENSLCLVTGDYDFSDLRLYPPADYHGIVVLAIPALTTSRYILQLVAQFLEQRAVLDQLPGKLAIVEAGRIRLRDS
jgi:predicted nuclease of predicted toxin-antitoxin system